MNKADRIEILCKMAQEDETFLYNEAIDIADVIDIVRERYEKMSAKVPRQQS